VTFAIAVSRLSALLLACAAAWVPRASGAESKDFRDWYVGCDNLRNCNAYGLQADDPSAAYVRIERGGAPAATARITIAADVGEKTRVVLAFDDPALRGLPSGPVAPERNDDDYGRVVIDDPAGVDTLVAGMRKAQTLVVRRIDPPGGAKSDPETSEISLSGAVAALLWIDEQQQRLGTTTAFIRRGDKPVSSIPPPPKAPVVRAAKAPPADAAPRPLPPNEARMLTAKARALCDDDKRTALDETYRLGRDTSLYGFSCPGNSGAYNYSFVFMIVLDGKPQAARPVKFADPAGTGAKTAPEDVLAINPGFDRSSLTLSTFNKGRGLGDCGEAAEWVFDGQTFQLSLRRVMPHCKGVPQGDWPVYFRADVR
jgi:Protein of unknown function (DUF1176)